MRIERRYYRQMAALPERCRATPSDFSFFIDGGNPPNMIHKFLQA